MPGPAHVPRRLLNWSASETLRQNGPSHGHHRCSITRSGVSLTARRKDPVKMAGRIRVALVNDYEIVLQGLRALLEPYAPGIAVVELDVNATPARTVDVTLLDTYGEATGMREQVQAIASDPSNGAIVVFSFSDDLAIANAAIAAGACGFISKATPARQIVDGIKAARSEERRVGK